MMWDTTTSTAEYRDKEKKRAEEAEFAAKMEKSSCTVVLITPRI